MDPKTLVLLALQVSILSTVFLFGLKTTVQDLLYLIHRPGLLARSLLAVFVLMPLMVVALDLLFDFRPPVEVVLWALAISPLPPLLPRKETGAGGNTSYGLGLMAVLAVVSIAAVPLSLEVLASVFGRELAMPARTIAALVVKTTLAPLLAGVAVRRLMPSLAARLERPLIRITTVLLTVAVLVLVAASASAIWAAVGDGTVLAMTIVTLAGLAMGHLLGRPDPDHSVVLALATSCRHPAIALTIAATNYPEQQFGGIILLYLVVNALVAIPYLRWQRRRSSAAAAAASAAAVTMLE
jgi:bile acid:Na+ symporter, BASS family